MQLKGVSSKNDFPALSYSNCDELTWLTFLCFFFLSPFELRDIDQHNCKHLAVRCAWYSAAPNHNRALKNLTNLNYGTKKKKKKTFTFGFQFRERTDGVNINWGAHVVKFAITTSNGYEKMSMLCLQLILLSLNNNNKKKKKTFTRHDNISPKKWLGLCVAVLMLLLNKQISSSRWRSRSVLCL